MNKKYSITFLSILGVLVIIMLYYITFKKETKIDEAYQVDNILLHNLDGLTINIFDSEYPFLLFFYKSSCDYCIEEAQQIVENISYFNCTQIYFISSEKHCYIKEFSDKLACNEIEFLQDKDGFLIDSFNIDISPTIIIYTRNKCIRRFSGVVPVEQLIFEVTND